MTQQNYKLNDLSTIFKKIEKDKNKSTLKSLEFILEINKTVAFDQILIREGYQSYPQKKKLEQKKIYKDYQDFFIFMKKELQTIQSNYLKNTNDIKLIEQAENNDQGQFNFLLNKNNISKFIRDEATHYQNILDKYLQEIPDLQQQKGINTQKWHNFFIELFTNKYVAVLKENQVYLQKQSSQIQLDMGNILKIYAKEVRQVTQKQSQKPFYITEENVLDFLTFWLKKESMNNLFVIYARTKTRLNQESKFITGQTKISSIHIHPSRMTSQQIILKQKQLEQQKNEQAQDNAEQIENNSLQNNQAEEEIRNTKIVAQQKSKSEQGNVQIQIQKQNQPTNQELLQAKLQSLFNFGCKRRYVLSKFTTFQEIENQSKTMTLDKFINFCNYFELLSIISKELLVEYFKMNAINMRTIDFVRFQKIIEKMVKIDKRIAQNFLQKSKFDKKLHTKQMKIYKRNDNPLSQYKFVLHPINGKDLSSLEKQISYKRLEKLIIKQEREKKVLEKKQLAAQQSSIVLKDTSKQIKKENFKKGMQRNYSQMRKMANSKVSHLELQNIRDNSFNPEKFMTIGDNDKLWQAYEAKIWKKQQNYKSALESILSKRIEKGTIVLNKLNSQRSLIYD